MTGIIFLTRGGGGGNLSFKVSPKEGIYYKSPEGVKHKSKNSQSIFNGNKISTAENNSETLLDA